MSSTMLDVKINRQEQTDLFEQVAAEIRRAIADGEAKPGERLPPARDLAAVLGVNTNTVLRSLRLLRDEGLLEFRGGRGIHVAAHRRARARPLPVPVSSSASPPAGLPHRRANQDHREHRQPLAPISQLENGIMRSCLTERLVLSIMAL
jgi:DNA-binding transcriptional regulator YhcF (GntR family)